MTIREAQEEMRQVYVDGAIGPFVSVTLYGLPHYAIAGVLMVAAGVALPSLRPGEFALGGWVGGALLVLLGVALLLGRRARAHHSP